MQQPDEDVASLRSVKDGDNIEGRSGIEASVRRDAWPWRLLATALSFGLFGLGGVAIGIVAVPALWLVPGSLTSGASVAR